MGSTLAPCGRWKNEKLAPILASWLPTQKQQQETWKRWICLICFSTQQIVAFESENFWVFTCSSYRRPPLDLARNSWPSKRKGSRRNMHKKKLRHKGTCRKMPLSIYLGIARKGSQPQLFLQDFSSPGSREFEEKKQKIPTSRR